MFSPRVSCLFFFRSPPAVGEPAIRYAFVAVAARIVAVVVNAINRMFRGRFQSHIFKEIFKLQPMFTDQNAATSIPVVAGITTTQTPSFHAIPASIFGCPISSVSGFVFYGFFYTYAPTAFHSPAGQTGATDSKSGSVIAFTLTKPHDRPTVFILPMAQELNHLNTPKSISGDVFNFRSDFAIGKITHAVVLLYNGVGQGCRALLTSFSPLFITNKS